MAPQFRCHRGVGIRSLADRKEPALTEKTRAASDRKRNHHTVADSHTLDFGTNSDDFTHEFMTEDVALLHHWYQTVI